MTAARPEAPVVLAAGGTGGHIFPAEALARVLLARGREVALLTDRRGQSFGERVPGVAVHRIRAGRFDAGLLGKVVGAAELAVGTVQARLKLRALAPTAVIGFGGYPSVPTVLAATRLGLPTVIHEQNALLGRANRLLAPRVAKIALSFAETGRLRPGEAARTSVTGNPVRPAIAALRDPLYEPPSADGPLDLLILGGSQGAHIFSEIVPDALASLPEAMRGRLRVSQQARPEDLDGVRRRYAETGIAASCASFFDDVPVRLACAHLVIARAGASTAAELTVAGRPALLVPYPHAADDHQSANAAALATSGAAWHVPQPAFTRERLAAFLQATLCEPAILAGAAAAARALGRPDAAERLADLAIGVGANGDHSIGRKEAA